MLHGQRATTPHPQAQIVHRRRAHTTRLPVHHHPRLPPRPTAAMDRHIEMLRPTTIAAAAIIATQYHSKAHTPDNGWSLLIRGVCYRTFALTDALFQQTKKHRRADGI